MSERLNINVNNSARVNEVSIREVIDNIDWGKINAVMEMLDWKWIGGVKVTGVPTVDELKDQAYDIASRAVSWSIEHKKPYEGGTGGIVARTRVWEDTGCISLDVVFELEGWSNRY